MRRHLPDGGAPAPRRGRARPLLLPAVLALLIAATAAAQAMSCRASISDTPMAEAQPVPLARPEWKARVGELEREMAGRDLSRVRLLFLGDSITQVWYDLIFNQFYGHRQPLNLGVMGDATQTLLWRLERIPLGGTLRPQLVVLLIGTNNLWPGVNPVDVADGIGEVVDQIRRRSPTSRILLVGLLPRGADPFDPLRQKQREVNALIARCADDMVTFADPGRMLVDGAGRMSNQIAFDYLHPTWLGYAILSAGLEPYVRRILGE